MNEDKQIEEMSKIASKCITSWLNNETPKVLPDYIAEALYTASYRKASDVAREIFEEISKASADWGCYCIPAFKWGYVTSDVSRTLAELKKKYTEGENGN